MTKRVGVVIGRFQVPEITTGQSALIRHAQDHSDELVILLGSSPEMYTKRNPLPHWLRASLISNFYPRATILPLRDRENNELWSADVDRLLDAVCLGAEITLYGGRDSFLPHYVGRFPKQEHKTPYEETGTLVRAALKSADDTTYEFARGIIHAIENQFTRVMPVIDVAIMKPLDTRQHVLMGRKKSEEQPTGYRFVGGFVDPGDTTLEYAVIREVREETDCEISSPRYVGSYRINDWRYRNTPETVLTTLFKADYLWGHIQPKDDINELKWIPLDELLENTLPIHQVLVKALLEDRDKL